MSDSIVHVTPKLLDRIVEARSPLLSLQTDEPAESIEEFRGLTLRSGQAVYAWNGAEGITSLGASRARLPGTNRLVDALRYIVHSVHFAIYLLHDFEQQIDPPAIVLLKRLCAVEQATQPRLVFLSADFEFPEDIAESIVPLQPGGPGMARPQLRDGHWVT